MYPQFGVQNSSLLTARGWQLRIPNKTADSVRQTSGQVLTWNVRTELSTKGSRSMY